MMIVHFNIQKFIEKHGCGVAKQKDIETADIDTKLFV